MNATIYKEHRQIRDEHAVLLEKFEERQAKNKAALNLLNQIEDLLQQHNLELQTKMAGIAAYEIEVQLDELLMPQHEASNGVTAIHTHFEEELTDLDEGIKFFDEFSNQYTNTVKTLMQGIDELM